MQSSISIGKDGKDPVMKESGDSAGRDSSGVKKNIRQVIWQKKNLIILESQKLFQGNSDVTSDVHALKTPHAFFKRFFPQSLIEYITDQSILYSAKKIQQV